jgi:hypothetical protein
MGPNYFHLEHLSFHAFVWFAPLLLGQQYIMGMGHPTVSLSDCEIQLQAGMVVGGICVHVGKSDIYEIRKIREKEMKVGCVCVCGILLEG